jgi:hypothetical protein
MNYSVWKPCGLVQGPPATIPHLFSPQKSKGYSTLPSCSDFGSVSYAHSVTLMLSCGLSVYYVHRSL